MLFQKESGEAFACTLLNITFKEGRNRYSMYVDGWCLCTEKTRELAAQRGLMELQRQWPVVEIKQGQNNVEVRDVSPERLQEDLEYVARRHSWCDVAGFVYKFNGKLKALVADNLNFYRFGEDTLFVGKRIETLDSDIYYLDYKSSPPDFSNRRQNETLPPCARRYSA